jgi:tetratricopeptide (TPR) repeat protein
VFTVLALAMLPLGIAVAQPAATPKPAAPAAAPAQPGAAARPAAPAAAGQRPATPAAGQRPGTAVNPLTNDLAKRAIDAAAKENYEEALNLFRDAYRVDKNPRWLYNMGVLYDRMANCDDSAFFYRAGMFGGGVLPQDRPLVDNRLEVLEEECHFKERHKLISDRHDRAARYMTMRLCALAEDILTGIITPAERQQVEACKAEAAKEK